VTHFNHLDNSVSWQRYIVLSMVKIIVQESQTQGMPDFGSILVKWNTVDLPVDINVQGQNSPDYHLNNSD
jgi:hypothetical protein